MRQPNINTTITNSIVLLSIKKAALVWKALKARGGAGSPGTETLRVAVEKKTVYSEFLESVVRRAEGEYSDVMGLMVRCQGLLISRWVGWMMRGILTEPLLQRQLERSSSIIDGAN